MIRHYITLALGAFRKTPFTTLANIFALALGLACFLGAYGASAYWRSGDAYQPYAERTYIVGTRMDIKAGGPAIGAGLDQHGLFSSSTVARYLKQDVPEVEQVARVSLPKETAVSIGDTKLMVHATFADPAFLDIFQLDFVAGDPRQALAQPNGIILTQNAAQRLFGSKPALGQQILIDNDWTGVVSGVIAPVRQPSFMGEGEDAVLRFDMLGAWSGNPAGAAADRRDSWLRLDAYTFAVLPPSMSRDAFSQGLAAMLKARIPVEFTKRATMTAAALPLADMATRKYDVLIASQLGAVLPVAVIVLVLGAIALAVAIVNYANLATAQAIMRAKEIGMRRVVGAGGAEIMLQTWIEALVQALIAFAAAIGFLALAAPAVRVLSGVDILFFLRNAGAWAIMGAVILLVAFAAGAYPAFVLSRVRPVSALRSGRSRTASRPIAQILVMIQFASASFLLLLMITAQLQRSHIESAVLTPREDPVLVLNDLATAGVDFDTLRTQLLSQPGVKSVSLVSRPPWASDTGTGMMVDDVRQVGRTPEQASSANFSYMKMVGLDYFDALNVKLLAGRSLEERDATTEQPGAVSQGSILIDALLARNLGYETPQAAVDQTIYVNGAPQGVIGVVEADMMRINGIAGEGAGTLYRYYATFPPYVAPRPVVRISGENIPATLAATTKVWDKLAPATPANFRFFDELFEASYRQQGRAGQLFVVLGSTCFLIASIGLLGIAVHAASQRRHEVAVRKTLGASIAGTVRLLLTGFSIPVLIGNLVAWPLGYLAAQTYLSAFAYRIELGPAPFVMSMAITLMIAWAAVIGVVLKAASLRPAEVLRHA